jgi:5-methylcytosine-specific restriction enzyme subunit McrC
MNEKPRYKLKEYETLRNISLSSSSVSILQSKFNKVVSINVTGESKWNITARSFVGRIELPDAMIEIHPKVPIPMILEWLTVAYDLRSLEWSQENTSYSSILGDVEWIVKCFILECRMIYSIGLRKGYVPIHEITGSVKGQWKPNTTFALWLKNDYRFDCQYDEFTTWMIENQCIYEGLLDMKKGTYHDGTIRQDMISLSNIFGAEAHTKSSLSHRNSTEEKVDRLNQIPMTRLNIHYKKAFNWLNLYWKGTTLSFEQGNLYAKCFVLDMNELFELYLGKRLESALHKENVEVIFQKHDRLAEGGKIKIIPDIILRNHVGKEIVVDTKYKLRKDERSVNDNVFQILAYMTAMKAESGILLYAIGPERKDKIRHTEKTIYQWSTMSAFNPNSNASDIMDDFEARFQGVVEGIIDIFNNEVTTK